MTERVMGHEVNFDGLAGPTHVFAGLATGNIAAAENAEQISNPRAAALQGLAKMRLLSGLGLQQGVLPPQERPHVPTLRRLGFSGDDHEVITRAAADAPGVFRAVCSASSMWAANAATVSAGADTLDGRVHFTPANLAAHLHRSIETDMTGRILKATFPADEHFVHHDALPCQADLGDEGAANHTRLVTSEGRAVQVFVYGRSAHYSDRATSKNFAARQTLEASEAVARQHGLDPGRVVFVQQDPQSIDQGVFHNDVISVGHRHVLLSHERAFADPNVTEKLRDLLGDDFRPIVVPAAAVTVTEAVSSYLFNSQIVTLPDGSIMLLCPTEVSETSSVASYVDSLLDDADSPIDRVMVVELRESMRNGGGPACLRLRVQLDEAQLTAVNPGSMMDRNRIDTLERWVERNYRDELQMSDLADSAFVDETHRALDELTQILRIGSIYDFQL